MTSRCTKHPEVSILLPAFEAEATIHTALESVRRQTFVDFECLVVDDGSTDNTGAIVTAIAAEDSRFRLLQTPHRGLVAALNTGHAAVRAELVARMDADDIMLRDRLRLQREAFNQHDRLALLGTFVRLFPGAAVGPGLRAYAQWLRSLRSPEDILRDRFIECPIPHPTWMLRKSVLDRFPYREEIWGEDYDLLLRLAEAGESLALMPRVLHLWREHPNRMTHSATSLRIESFTAARAHFLASGPLRNSRDYILWGYGRTGRALRRALLKYDKHPSHMIEVHPRRIGQTIHGAPVVGADAIGGLPHHPILVSVAGIGPRETVRTAMRAWNRIEGSDFFCTA